jgi:recombination protein RecA
MAAKKARVSENRTGAVFASEWMSKIRKKFGDNIVEVASDAHSTEVQRIPTGVFALDYALGGGFPAGRVNTVYGNKSSAKTTTILKAIGSAQTLCAICFTKTEGGCTCGENRDAVAAFIDIEGTFEKKWAEAHGVVMDRLLISRPEYAEQGLDIAEAMLRSNECDVLAIDSIAFLTAMKEIEESTEKDLVGTQARLLGKGIRKFVSALNQMANENDGRKPTIFLVNQLRMKVGLMFGNPEVQPGGMAAGFAASTETKFWSGKYKIDDETKRPMSVEMNFRVEKNKTFAARMEGSFNLVLADTQTKKLGAVHDEDFLISMGEKIGLVERKGVIWHVLGKEFRKKEDMETALLTDAAFGAEMRKTLMQVLLAS